MPSNTTPNLGFDRDKLLASGSPIFNPDHFIQACLPRLFHGQSESGALALYAADVLMAFGQLVWRVGIDADNPQRIGCRAIVVWTDGSVWIIERRRAFAALDRFRFLSSDAIKHESSATADDNRLWHCCPICGATAQKGAEQCGGCHHDILPTVRVVQSGQPCQTCGTYDVTPFMFCADCDVRVCWNCWRQNHVGHQDKYGAPAGFTKPGTPT